MSGDSSKSLYCLIICIVYNNARLRGHHGLFFLCFVKVLTNRKEEFMAVKKNDSSTPAKKPIAEVRKENEELHAEIEKLI